MRQATAFRGRGRLGVLGIHFLFFAAPVIAQEEELPEVVEDPFIENNYQKVVGYKYHILSRDTWLLSVHRLIDKGNSPASTTEFLTDVGPIWQVELRDFPADPSHTLLIPPSPNPYAPVRVMAPYPDISPLEMSNQTDVRMDQSRDPATNNPTHKWLELRWTNIRAQDTTLPGPQNQLLNVTVRIDAFDPSDPNNLDNPKTFWDIHAELVTDPNHLGPWVITSIRFPFFAMDTIGADGETGDQIILPFAGGMTLDRPAVLDPMHGNQKPERLRYCHESAHAC